MFSAPIATETQSISDTFLVTASLASSIQLRLRNQIALTTDEEGGSARPEIIAMQNRVFILYLGNIQKRDARTFCVKIFSADFSELILSKEIVIASQEYGGPTDIRVDSDGQSVYAFYETRKTLSPSTGTTYLWGAKFALDDRFEQVASTPAPIASSKSISELPDGGELLDDPTPLIGEQSVFVMTRLKSSLAGGGRTVYRVREFDKDQFALRNQFDLDVSEAADGGAQVAGLRFDGAEGILLALTSVRLDSAPNKGAYTDANSDILLIRMHRDWTFDAKADVVTLSSEPGDREHYVSGIKLEGGLLYITYIESIGDAKTAENIAWIKIFDSHYQLLWKERVISAIGAIDQNLIRPSLEVRGDVVYSGESSGEGLSRGNAKIFIYSLVRN